MKICMVCSTGGHLTEVLTLKDAFIDHELFFITHDSTRTRDLLKDYHTYYVTHYVENKLIYLLNPIIILPTLLKEKPDLVVSTGSEIAIPIFLTAKALGIRTMFIETLTRVNEPSGTGKIIYRLSDVFLVQWEPLLKKYGSKAEYWGSLY